MHGVSWAGFIQFIQKDISDSRTLLLDMTLRLLMQLLVQWKSSITNATTTTTSAPLPREVARVSDELVLQNTCMQKLKKTKHACMHACVHLHMHTHIHTCMHAHTHTHTNTHAYMHARTHTYTHTAQGAAMSVHSSSMKSRERMAHGVMYTSAKHAFALLMMSQTQITSEKMAALMSVFTSYLKCLIFNKLDH